jgi:S-adenosylmethionine decarboxylase
MSELGCPEQFVGLFAGKHVLAELAGISHDVLDNERRLCQALRAALIRADATVLTIVSNRFVPQGVTVVALLAESHASLHTYPEVGAAFVDVFTCGDRAKPALAVEYLAQALGARVRRTDSIDRGQADGTGRLGVMA